MKIIKKKTIARILLAAVFLAGFVMQSPQTAAATSTYQATARVSVKEGAYIRKSPSTSARKVKLAKKNTAVVIKEEVFVSNKSTAMKNKWYAVTVLGKSGYIRSDMVSGTRYSAGNRYTTDALNYRVGPDAKMSRKGTLKKNSKVQVVLKSRIKGSKSLWYKVRINGKYYYVDSRYTTTSAPKASTAKSSTASKITASSNIAKTIVVRGSNGESSGITIADLSYPVSLPEGSGFGLKGVIQSESTMSSLKFEIVDSSGNIKISESVTTNSKTFNVKDVDARIKFGNLTNGSYTYRITITYAGKTITAAKYNFKIVKVNGPRAITENAIALAWPKGTSSGKYKYKTGSQYGPYKKAMDAVFPKHNTWGKYTSVGASCDVFVSTVCRYSGYDSSMPTALNSQIKYLESSKKWNLVNYSFRESDLRNGDIIVYKRTNGQGHICIYAKVGGKGCLIEAAYKEKYSYVNTSLKKVLTPASNVKWLKVYRANA